MTKNNQKTKTGKDDNKAKSTDHDDSNYYKAPLEGDVSQTSSMELSDMASFMRDNGWVWDAEQEEYVLMLPD